MIIDLDEALYVIDDRTHEHRISNIDVINKIVYCTDNTSYPYSTHPLTIIIKKDEIY